MPRFFIVILLAGGLVAGCHSRHQQSAAVPADSAVVADAVRDDTETAPRVSLAPEAPETPVETVAPADTMPLESVFEIDGTFGSRIGMPYKITLTQKDRIVRYSAKVFFDELNDQPVDIAKFRQLWAVCQKMNLESLKLDYGQSCGPADFHGTFTCRVRLPGKTVDKTVKLTYGTIVDTRFARLYDAIMAAVSPEAHLPFYAIRTIDYTRLPQRAVFCLQVKNDESDLVSRMTLTAEGDRADCRMTTETPTGSAETEQVVSPRAFTSFWGTCAAVDLTELDDFYGDVRDFGDFHWDLAIEVETDTGCFTKQITFPNRPLGDSRFAELLDSLLALADNKLTFPLQQANTAYAMPPK